MYSFIISLFLLVAGYVVYGRFVEKVFSPDDRVTPAYRMNDGIDYVVLPGWKVFMIQFLNIAGTGPIFGAIMGAWYGPSAYLWIVFGCIFAGAVHDYSFGMASLRGDGASMPHIVGQNLGSGMHKFILVFSCLVLLLVGAVFVLSPATILSNLMSDGLKNILIWVTVIFIYYAIATMLPVDKVIGKIYPLFAFSLIFMAVALLVVLFIKMPVLPEVWDGVTANLGEEKLGIKNSDPLFPALFITIACGAISGFHSTQSPLMARCIKSEKQGRAVFYGSMITEGIIALIWCTASSWFFYNEGWREVCTPEVIAEFTGQTEKTVTQFFSAPTVVMHICNGWLGAFGGVLAVLGVVAAPITSGDTALRSARLIVAETLHINQTKIGKRLLVSIPIFLVVIALIVWQVDNPDSFNVIWKYFGWANQTLAVVTLWTITVYLVRHNKPYWFVLIPSMFMTVVSVSFIMVSKTALNLPATLSYVVAVVVAFIFAALFFRWKTKFDKNK